MSEEVAALREEMPQQVMNLAMIQSEFSKILLCNDDPAISLEETLSGVQQALHQLKRQCHNLTDYHHALTIFILMKIMYECSCTRELSSMIRKCLLESTLLKDDFMSFSPLLLERLELWDDHVQDVVNLYTLLQDNNRRRRRHAGNKSNKRRKVHVLDSTTFGNSNNNNSTNNPSFWTVKWVCLLAKLAMARVQATTMIEWITVERMVLAWLRGSGLSRIDVTAGLALAALDVLNQATSSPSINIGGRAVQVTGLTVRHVFELLQVPSVIDLSLVGVAYPTPRLLIMTRIVDVLLTYAQTYLEDDDALRDAARVCMELMQRTFVNSVPVLLNEIDTAYKKSSNNTNESSSSSSRKRKQPGVTANESSSTAAAAAQKRMGNPSYPFVVQVKVLLANDKVQEAIHVCHYMEASTALHKDDKHDAWTLVMDYLRNEGRLLLDGNYDASSLGVYNKRRNFLLIMRRETVCNLGFRAMIDYYKYLIEQCTKSKFQITPEEQQYITLACQRTILLLLLDKYGDRSGVERMLQEFPSLYAWQDGGGNLLKWAQTFILNQSNPIPESLLMEDGYSVDLESLWHRSPPAIEEEAGVVVAAVAAGQQLQVEESVTIEQEVSVVAAKTQEPRVDQEEPVEQKPVQDEEKETRVEEEGPIEPNKPVEEMEEQLPVAEVAAMAAEQESAAVRPPPVQAPREEEQPHVEEILSSDEEEQQQQQHHAVEEIASSEEEEEFFDSSEDGVEPQAGEAMQQAVADNGAIELVESSTEEEQEEAALDEEERSEDSQSTQENRLDRPRDDFDETEEEEEEEEDTNVAFGGVAGEAIDHYDDEEIMGRAPYDEDVSDGTYDSQADVPSEEDGGVEREESSEADEHEQQDETMSTAEGMEVDQEQPRDSAMDVEQMDASGVQEDAIDSTVTETTTTEQGQIDRGYEPDTTAQTEEEEDDDKVIATIPKSKTPPPVRGLFASRTTLSDMDAADERTEPSDVEDARKERPPLSSSKSETSSSMAVKAQEPRQEPSVSVKDDSYSFQAPAARQRRESVEEEPPTVQIVNKVPKIADVHESEEGTNATVEGRSTTFSIDEAIQAEPVEEEKEVEAVVVDHVPPVEDARVGDDATSVAFAASETGQYLSEFADDDSKKPEGSAKMPVAKESPVTTNESKTKSSRKGAGNETDGGYMGDIEDKPPTTSAAPATSAAISMQAPGYEADVEERSGVRDDESRPSTISPAVRAMPIGLSKKESAAEDDSIAAHPPGTHDGSTSGRVGFDLPPDVAATHSTEEAPSAATQLDREAPEETGASDDKDAAIAAHATQQERMTDETEVTEEPAGEEPSAETCDVPDNSARHTRSRDKGTTNSSTMQHERASGEIAASDTDLETSNEMPDVLDSSSRHTRSHDTKEEESAATTEPAAPKQSDDNAHFEAPPSPPSTSRRSSGVFESPSSQTQSQNVASPPTSHASSRGSAKRRSSNVFGSPAKRTRSHDLGSPAKHTRSHDKHDEDESVASPTPKKRGRGRPRKLSSPTRWPYPRKRGPGRPRKHPVEDDETKSTPKKRGPGRPRKTPKPEDDEESSSRKRKEAPDDDTTASTVSTATRRSTRLQARKSEEKDEEEQSSTPKKRKVGRPRKKIPPEEESHRTSEVASASSEPPKKRRGRPPAVKKASRGDVSGSVASKETADAEEFPPKKRRGRPPKIQEPEKDAPEPEEAESTSPPKKRRGRPPKAKEDVEASNESASAAVKTTGRATRLRASDSAADDLPTSTPTRQSKRARRKPAKLAEDGDDNEAESQADTVKMSPARRSRHSRRKEEDEESDEEDTVASSSNKSPSVPVPGGVSIPEEGDGGSVSSMDSSSVASRRQHRRTTRATAARESLSTIQESDGETASTTTASRAAKGATKRKTRSAKGSASSAASTSSRATRSSGRSSYNLRTRK